MESRETGTMMNWALSWLVIGIVVGTGHAATLWRSASRPDHVGWNVLLRLAAVGLVLVSGAETRQLVPVVAGWVCGFVATGLLVCTRSAA